VTGEGSIAEVLAGEARWNVTCADCLDVLPGLRVDLVLTDPPYGIGKWSSAGGNSISSEEAIKVSAWDVLPSAETLSAAVAAGTEAIVWGGNYLCGALGAFRSPLVWDKGIRGMHFADGEMAWTSFDHGTLRILQLSLARTTTKGNKDHPTQKPVEVMTWCIGQARNPQTILDPFAGSGTTGVAALRLGCRVILVERDADYASLCRERLRAEEQGSTLQARKAGQVALFGGKP